MKDRDLLFFSTKFVDNKTADYEAAQLNELLYRFETFHNFCIAHELIDVNRYKIITQPFLLQKAMKDNLKPFVFLNCKN